MESQQTEQASTAVQLFQLTRVGKGNPDYYCTTCREFMTTAHQSQCCKKHFCDDCIKDAHKKCPNPDCKSEEFQHHIDKKVSQRIQGLPITCRHSCGWKGIISENREHLLDHCQEHVRECKSPGCHHTCVGKDMAQHMRDNAEAHIQNYLNLQKDNFKAHREMYLEFKEENGETEKQLKKISHQLGMTKLVLALAVIVAITALILGIAPLY